MRANNQSKPQKKPPPQKKKQDRHIQSSDSDMVVGGGSKGKDKQKVTTEVPCNAAIPQAKGEVDNVSSDLQYIRKEDTDEVDWEDGYIPASGLSNHQPNHVREVVVEFDHSPSSLKKKSIRRASAEDKELAELVHRVHLLCLLARGRLVDAACDDPLIQAALLSLLPRHLLKIAELPKVTTNALTGLLEWFHDNFHAGNPSSSERSFKSSLAFALENRQGAAEEVVALSVALFRALNLTARFVSILDVASLKPDSDMSGGSSQDATRMESGIFNSSTLMVTQSRQASVSAIQSSSRKLTFKDEMTHRSSHDSGLQISENYKATQSTCNLANASLPSIESNDSSGKCLKKKVEKRKGDLEFELQMEMALSATRAHQNNLVKDLPSSSSSTSSPASRFKKIKSEEGISTAVGSRKVGPPLYWAEVFCNGENITGRWVHIDAVNAIIDGAEKVEAATAACKRTLRYVVAFAGSGAKDVTRRYCTKWYKIASKRIDSQWWDEVLAPLMRFESSATGGTVCLDEVGAITKLGSVDACVSGNIESSTQKSLTDEKLSSEMSNQYGTDVDFKFSMPTIATRDCLEDMELQTRALTEPLPINQQVYRNHPLYVIERWLTKYQVLRPKGPILGYCSSHPVYPRTCVQILQTEQRWLRDGLQIRAHESPAKMVKRSLKQSKAHDPESGACDDNREGTIALYGKWQTEPLVLPHAENGIVPRNERGQVDVWSEKCLPPGTVHLRYPRLVPVAKRLEIDFAPAMVGFEFRNGRSYPVYEGIVVCSEFKDAIMEAYAEEEDRRETEDKKRDEVQALSRWYQLLSSIITRQRLKDTYGDGSSSQKTYHLNQKDDVCGVQGTNIGDKMESNESQQKYVAKSDPVQFVEDHQHTFPVEDQTFDEESCVRTKLCPCGFVLQVEEL